MRVHWEWHNYPSALYLVASLTRAGARWSTAFTCTCAWLEPPRSGGCGSGVARVGLHLGTHRIPWRGGSRVGEARTTDERMRPSRGAYNPSALARLQPRGSAARRERLLAAFGRSRGCAPVLRTVGGIVHSARAASSGEELRVGRRSCGGCTPADGVEVSTPNPLGNLLTLVPCICTGQGEHTGAVRGGSRLTVDSHRTGAGEKRAARTPARRCSGAQRQAPSCAQPQREVLRSSNVAPRDQQRADTREGQRRPAAAVCGGLVPYRLPTGLGYSGPPELGGRLPNRNSLSFSSASGGSSLIGGTGGSSWSG